MASKDNLNRIRSRLYFRGDGSETGAWVIHPDLGTKCKSRYDLGRDTKVRHVDFGCVGGRSYRYFYSMIGTEGNMRRFYSGAVNEDGDARLYLDEATAEDRLIQIVIEEYGAPPYQILIHLI